VFGKEMMAILESTKVGVILKFTIQEAKKEEFVKHLEQTAQLTNDEAGTLLWLVSTSPVEPSSVWLYETYASQEAKALHESSAAYAEARTKTDSFLAWPPQVFPLIPLFGKGL
jgi:quinol monooxygenase YgiN